MAHRVRFWVPVLGCLLLPVSAWAQAISGTVTDASGLVIPGVTVAASSPALIEQSRTVVTNEAGRYTILNLRPGTYGVTFSLAGFNEVKREGIVLTSDFTAQVNAQLQAGAIEESVTVTGQSPVVDVRGTATPTVLTRDVMDALPTERSVTSLAKTIPGTGDGPFGQIMYRGTFDAVTSVDGMRTTHLTGAGPAMTATPFNNGMFEEYSFSTAIDSAERGQPGLVINLVPKDGGNRYSGSLFTTFTHDGWQASNLTDTLRNPPLNFRDVKTVKAWDFNPSFGGPIRKDRLWFYGTFRYFGSNSQVLDFEYDANPSPLVFDRDLVRPPALNESWGVTGSGRITWQASQKDKISGFYDKPYSVTPFSRNPQLGTAPPPEATVRAESNNHNFGVRWTRTHTSRLLLEAGYSDYDSIAYNDYSGALEPWGAAHVTNIPSGRPPAYAVLDRSANRQIGVANVAGGNESRTLTLSSAATYVTGSHALKAGFTFFSGSYERPQTVAGNFTLAVIDRVVNGTRVRGTPDSVTLTLPGNEINNIDGDWGMYVQDRWTIGRLAMNLGLRYDWLMTSVPEQRLPASRWLGEQTFAPRDVLNLKDLSPRLGAAYDLFGTGKTALKVALARYVAGETVALTRAANPILTIATTDQRSWTDANGDATILNEDGSVQWNEIGPTNNANFGRTAPGTTFDPEVLGGWFNRGYSWETNVSVQHELLPRVAVTALYYRRTAGNQRVNDNLRVGPDDYDEFCITTPVDPGLPGGGGQRVCGLYDLEPAFRGLVDNYNTFATNLGTRKGFTEITSGYELSVNARLPNGAFIQAGVNLNRNVYNTQRTGIGGTTLAIQACHVIDTPETRYCNNDTPLRPDVKINGSYTLPWAIEVSGSYQGLAGPEVLAVLSVSPADAAAAGAPYFSSLGRTLTAGTAKLIPLVEPGERYHSMRHLVDFRFGRTFRLAPYRIKAMVDLYNLFNSSALSAVNSTYGPSWQRPTTIASGRQVRMGLQLDF